MGWVVLMTAVAAQAAGPQLTAAGKWAVAYEPTECLLSRPFGSGDGAVTLGLLRYPASRGGTVLLVTSDGEAETRRGTGKIIVRPSGQEFATTWATMPRPGRAGGLTRIEPPPEFWEALPQATDLAVVQGAKTDATDLPIGRMTSALAAYNKCNDSLLRLWGADPAAMIAPGSWSLDWFRYSDYPESAVRRRAEGRVVALIAVDTSGRATSCKIVKSAGDADLDRQTCALTRKRARIPQSAGGVAATRWVVLPVNWSLPTG